MPKPLAHPFAKVRFIMPALKEPDDQPHDRKQAYDGGNQLQKGGREERLEEPPEDTIRPLGDGEVSSIVRDQLRPQGRLVERSFTGATGCALSRRSFTTYSALSSCQLICTLTCSCWRPG